MVATIILLVFMAVNLGIHLAKHKEYRDDKYNFWWALFGVGVNLLLYYYAGLFDNFK